MGCDDAVPSEHFGSTSDARKRLEERRAQDVQARFTTREDEHVPHLHPDWSWFDNLVKLNGPTGLPESTADYIRRLCREKLELKEQIADLKAQIAVLRNVSN